MNKYLSSSTNFEKYSSQKYGEVSINFDIDDVSFLPQPVVRIDQPSF